MLMRLAVDVLDKNTILEDFINIILQQRVMWKILYYPLNATKVLLSVELYD